MAEGTDREPSGVENEGVDEDVRSTGDEGARTAGTTPPIGDESVPGQTAVPAGDEDVGVPPDEEMGEPDE
jgi:hypothetical protein